jgi:hypothetical protein
MAGTPCEPVRDGSRLALDRAIARDFSILIVAATADVLIEVWKCPGPSDPVDRALGTVADSQGHFQAGLAPLQGAGLRASPVTICPMRLAAGLERVPACLKT